MRSPGRIGQGDVALSTKRNKSSMMDGLLRIPLRKKLYQLQQRAQKSPRRMSYRT
jgi:hypothetical protein